MFDAKTLANLNYSSVLPVAYWSADRTRIYVGLPTGCEYGDDTGETYTTLVLVGVFSMDTLTLAPLTEGLDGIPTSDPATETLAVDDWHAQCADLHAAMWQQQQDVDAAERLLRHCR